MARPQKENGYTPVANEILDNIIKASLNGTQIRIILTVWRYTYGFSRKQHILSETFISTATGVHKKQIQRELNKLIQLKIIDVIEPATFNKSRVLGFNKNYDTWELIRGEVTKTLPPNENDTYTGSELVTSPGSELATQDKQVLKQILKQVSSKGISDIQNAFQNNGLGLFVRVHLQDTETFLDQDKLEADLIIEAIEIAARASKSWNYAKGILRQCILKNIKTLEQFKAVQAHKQRGDSSGETKDTGDTREYAGGVIDYSKGFANMP